MLELPWPHRDLSPNARPHWAAKARAVKIARKTAWALLLADAGDASNVFHVTFRPPDKRRRDIDNLIAAFKAYQDGIADAMGVDDSTFRVTYSIGEPKGNGGVIVVAFK